MKQFFVASIAAVSRSTMGVITPVLAAPPAMSDASKSAPLSRPAKLLAEALAFPACRTFLASSANFARCAVLLIANYVMILTTMLSWLWNACA